MRVALSFLCYLLAAVAFTRAILIGRPLPAERIDRSSQSQDGSAAGGASYTPAGEVLRRRVMVLTVIGFVFLALAVAL